VFKQNRPKPSAKWCDADEIVLAVGRIWSAAASEARRRFSNFALRISVLGHPLKSGVALRLPPRSIFF